MAEAKKEPNTPVQKITLTLQGGQKQVHPWWNMRAIKKLKEEYSVKVQEVMQDLFDPDKVVPFYLVGLDAREPGQWTMDQLLDQLEFTDMLTLQAQMTNIAKAFGLDVAVPLQTTTPETNGANSGVSV